MTHMDLKFHGDVFKNKDGSKVPDDQWIVFLVKDDAVPGMLLRYLHGCLELGAEEAQVAGVLDLIDRVKEWREAHPELCKVPDVDPGELQSPRHITDCMENEDCWLCEEGVPHTHGPIDRDDPDPLHHAYAGTEEAQG